MAEIITENQNVDYVRRDVFEASMQRLEALMERTLARQEAIASEMKADNESLRSEIRVVNTRLDGVDQRISDLQTVVYWGFAIVGLFVGFATLAPFIAEFFRNFRRPSVSAEDVQAMIDAAIAKALKLEGK